MTIDSRPIRTAFAGFGLSGSVFHAPLLAADPAFSVDVISTSDADRQAAADRLRAAHDEGRLDLHEYDRRLADAYAAVTYGDLDRLFTDLPGRPAPVPSVAGAAAAARTAAAPAALRAARIVPVWRASHWIWCRRTRSNTTSGAP